MPSGGYHGPTHPGLPGGMSTSREARDASRDGALLPPEGSNAFGRVSSRLWNAGTGPALGKRDACRYSWQLARCSHGGGPELQVAAGAPKGRDGIAQGKPSPLPTCQVFVARKCGRAGCSSGGTEGSAGLRLRRPRSGLRPGPPGSDLPRVCGQGAASRGSATRGRLQSAEGLGRVRRIPASPSSPCVNLREIAALAPSTGLAGSAGRRGAIQEGR